MLCYRDMMFCTASCQTVECERNKKGINPKHVEKVGLPIMQRDFSRECESYVEDKE